MIEAEGDSRRRDVRKDGLLYLAVKLIEPLVGKREGELESARFSEDVLKIRRLKILKFVCIEEMRNPVGTGLLLSAKC